MSPGTFGFELVHSNESRGRRVYSCSHWLTRARKVSLGSIGFVRVHSVAPSGRRVHSGLHRFNR